MKVSINGGTPKWMVYNRKSHSNRFGGIHMFRKKTHVIYIYMVIHNG